MNATDADTEGHLPAPYEFLYEDAPCGFLSMLPSGAVLSVNRTLLNWTGYTAADVIGKPLSAFLDRGSQLF